MKKFYSPRNRFTKIAVIISMGFIAAVCSGAESTVLPAKFFPYGVLHSIADNFPMTKDWRPVFSRQANLWGQSNTNIVCIYGIGAPPNVLGLLPVLGKYDIKVWGSLYMPMAYKPKHPEIVEKTGKYLNKYKDDDRIYAFAIKDEPKQQHYKLYAESVEFIRKHDPNHKIVSIFCHNENVIPYLSLMDTVAIDIYPVRDRVRDPWWIADQCADMLKIIKGKNKNLIVMPPAHTFYCKDYIGKTKKMIKDIDSPTVEEFRLMSWLSIANGADGVVYFLYKWPSAWIKERKKAIGRGFANMIGVPGPLWKEYKNIGWEMRPIGGIIAGSQVVPVRGMRVVDNKYFTLPESSFAKIEYPRKKRELISIYCRQHKGRNEKYYFIVNNDVGKRQKVKLMLNSKLIVSALDLLSLQFLKPDANGMVHFTLEPGMAMVLMTGSPDMQKQAKVLVVAERVKMRKNQVLAKIAELRNAGVILDKSQFEQLLKNVGGETNADALDKLNAIYEKLQQAVIADKTFSSNSKLLTKAAAAWTRADDILEKRTISIRSGNAPELDSICKQMVAYAKEYYSIKTYLMGWKQANNKRNYASELNALIDKLTDLNKRLDKLVRSIPEDKRGLYSRR